MQDKLILKLSIIISVLGILILLFLSNVLEPKISKIKDINQNNIYQKIKLSGKITYIKTYSNFQIIELNDNSGKINVLLNGPKLSLTKNQTIAVIGKITEYKNETQVTADKIII